jgi:hypothetical protein
MKAVIAALAILLLAPQEDEAAKKAQRIERALGWLANEDADVREMGRKDLEKIGRDAIPAIEKKVAEKGATDLVQLLRHLDRAPGAADQWVAEQELRDIEVDEQFRKESAKLSKDVAEKYAYVKYQEALAHVRHKNYQRAFDLANALIAMESRSSNIDAYKRLRRHCENMITQTSLIEAKILQPKVWFVEGEAVELSARMKNIYKAPMTLLWDKGTAQDPGGGLVVLEVEITMNELGGSSSSDQRHQDLRFEEEVPIAPGAQWERKFVLDTSTAITDEKQIRIIKVGGWTQPPKISTDAVNITRKLTFEPALVKIIPKAFARFLENPLEWLDKMIAEGTPRDVYVCSQLLEGDDRDRGAEKLIKLLEKSETPIGKVTVVNILSALTGQSLGADPRRWHNWLQTKGSDSKDKKKK